MTATRVTTMIQRPEACAKCGQPVMRVWLFGAGESGGYSSRDPDRVEHLRHGVECGVDEFCIRQAADQADDAA
jgi:hypothetical protein